MSTSEYLNKEAKDFSLYTLQSRALAHATDGLKPAARRLIWTARDGKTYKSAALAGATMPLHPHAAPEDALNTITGFYVCNIPLLKGDGAFGTRLQPHVFGASRYTSVKLSKFTEEIIFTDKDIIPMMENYDSTLMEPKYFLPLVPIAVCNIQEGIGVGFSTDILSRELSDIIDNQISHLKDLEFSEPLPVIIPLKQYAKEKITDNQGKGRWIFNGEVEILNTTTVLIKNLPYGLSHSNFIKKLITLLENGEIVDYDDGSKNFLHIEVKLTRAKLSEISNNLLEFFGLISKKIENFTLLNFDGRTVLETNYIDYIKEFTTWRLMWFIERYIFLKKEAEHDLQRYRDIEIAIINDLGSIARKLPNKPLLKEKCKNLKIINIDYILDLPVYIFTDEERIKNTKKIIELETNIKEYNRIINSDSAQIEIYIKELEEIKSKYLKGYYK